MSRFFSVKNFERFQHYKDRSPPWIKLYNELLDDYDFGRLQDASKMHLVAIWLLASRYDNRIPYDAEWIARRINATSRVDLETLAKSGFISPDQGCSEPLAERKQDAMPETEGEGETEREKDTRTRATLDGFDDWYALFPNKVGKGAAMKAWPAAKRKASQDELVAGLRRYIANKPTEREWCNPATWLNQQRWLDQPAKPKLVVNAAVPPLGVGG